MTHCPPASLRHWAQPVYERTWVCIPFACGARRSSPQVRLAARLAPAAGLWLCSQQPQPQQPQAQQQQQQDRREQSRGQEPDAGRAQQPAQVPGRGSDGSGGPEAMLPGAAGSARAAAAAGEGSASRQLQDGSGRSGLHVDASERAGGGGGGSGWRRLRLLSWRGKRAA